MATRLTFGEWLPDQPGAVGTLQKASNVIPIASGYAPLPSLVDYSQDASEDLNAVFSGRRSTSSIFFAGGASKLFKLDPTDFSLDDVSKTGGYSSSYPWDFVQFGTSIIAANGTEKLQNWVLNSSSQFADLDAAAPVARYVTVVRDFVVCGNISGAENRVQWSDINDETNWTAGASSQSDYQNLPDGGGIQGITGGEFGLILLDRSIVRMSYIGSPLFFQFDTISRNRGCLEPGSIAQYGQMTFFLSDDGFYSCAGESLTPIGAEKVNRWFFNDANPSTLSTISAATDPLRNVVVWSYQNNEGGRSLLVYNWQLNRWSHGTTTAETLSSAATTGETLESLDSISGSLDSLGTSLDSPQWVGGSLLFAGSVGAKIATFTGASSTALFETGDFGDANPSMVTLARPLIDGGSASVAAFSRNLLGQTIGFGSRTAADSDNRVPLRSLGKYHRLQVEPSGTWTAAVAVDVEMTGAGVR